MDTSGATSNTFLILPPTLPERIAPQVSRIGFLYNPQTAPYARYYLDTFRAANADRFGHCCKIRICELGAELEETGGLLLELDEARRRLPASGASVDAAGPAPTFRLLRLQY
jgi:hypothetical protein